MERGVDRLVTKLRRGDGREPVLESDSSDLKEFCEESVKDIPGR